MVVVSDLNSPPDDGGVTLAAADEKRPGRARPSTEIAERFGITSRTVRRLNERGRECGTMPPWQDGGALFEWFLHWHSAPPPAWLERARVAAEARNPRVERPVAVRMASAETPTPAGEPLVVDDGSDLAVARRIVAARRAELDQCEALPLDYAGRDGKLRNAQEAFFKAQEQQRKMADYEAQAEARAVEMMEQTKPHLAAIMRRYGDLLRAALLGEVPEERRVAVEDGMRQVLVTLHEELATTTL